MLFYHITSILLVLVSTEEVFFEDEDEYKRDDSLLSKVDVEKYSLPKEKRYFIYDVNHGEGFNLRRDVYMRIANTVRILRESGDNWVLVLPPWGGLYHWDKQETKMKWSEFFDLESLNLFVPVMEFEDYLEENPSNIIDHVVYLQHYKEGWGGEYKLKYDRRDCMDNNQYRKEKDMWRGWFFSYSFVRAKTFECISFQGDSVTLANMIKKEYPTQKSLFIDRGETVLHHEYGEKHYWQARRSMRYSKELIQIGNKFRRDELKSSDRKDGTPWPSSWQDEPEMVEKKGGDYICSHWRRRDFVRAHGKDLPSIKGTANHLNELAKKYKVSKIFLATDAPPSEVKELSELLDYPVVTYKNDTLSDGAVAIIDQWICAHARYFTGSHHSTFSFRIQEDREILGFPKFSTFNRLCPDGEKDCEQPAKWGIVY